jgi:hypothetical protein
MIVKYTNETVPVIDGLIMIDCWSPRRDQKKDYKNFYVPLLSKLINFDFKCIVNAAYNVTLSTEDLSIRNTFQNYYWPESKDQNVNIVQNLIKHCAGSNRTNSLFQETLLDNANSIMLFEFDDFVYHWRNRLDCKINNWLVVGQTWKNCVHNRPIGLDVFYRNVEHSQLNFYALTDGFNTDERTGTTHKHFQQDNLPWSHIDNFGYRLITRANKHWTQSMDFYRECMSAQHIVVEIHCTADIAPLITSSDDTFDITVVYEPTESWQFSYSKFAGAYQLDESTNQKNIKIWVFDITEPLDLEVLMKHTNPMYSSFITKNQKIVIFETSRITSTHEIENFVK